MTQLNLFMKQTHRHRKHLLLPKGGGEKDKLGVWD